MWSYVDWYIVKKILEKLPAIIFRDSLVQDSFQLLRPYRGRQQSPLIRNQLYTGNIM